MPATTAHRERRSANVGVPEAGSAKAIVPTNRTSTTSEDNPASEAQLIKRAQSDAVAFGELYELHYPSIANYLYRRTGDRHATEDLTSEVFLSALRGIARYRHRGIPFRYWLLRIATNAANKWAKKDQRSHPQCSDLDSHVLKSSNSGGRVDEISDERVPELIQHGLKQLPSAQQTVIALHYFEDLTIEQIAVVLRVRSGTVKSRLHRARQSLRNIIQISEDQNDV